MSFSLLRDHDVACVWTAGLVSATGSLAMFVVLPVVVFSSTGSAWTTALTALGGTLPAVVIGQIGGVITDRMDRRRLLLGANAGMAALTCLFLGLSTAPWWAFALVNLAIACLAQVAAPAEHALLGDLVPVRRLGEGASLNALNANLARLIGPAIGGLAFAQVGFRLTVAFDALTFAVAAALVWRVRHRSTVGTDLRRSWSTDWSVGWRAVRSQPPLRRVVVVGGLAMFGEGAVSALMAPWAEQLLGRGAGLLGAIFTAQAVGGIAGAWWAARRTSERDPVRLLGWSAVAAGIASGVAFGYPVIIRVDWPAIALTALAGFPFATFAAAQGYALQILVSPELRGRVYALAAGLFGLAQLLGIVASGATAERWGALMIILEPTCYLIAGLLALGLAGPAGRTLMPFIGPKG